MTCTDIIKEFEGFSEKPYLCPAGVPTIGYGFTTWMGRRVTMSYPGTITPAQAQNELVRQSTLLRTQIIALVSIKLTANQLDALTSFVWNIGIGAFKASTLLKYLNQNEITQASGQFPRWNKIGTLISPGLTRRRKIERALFDDTSLEN